MIKSNKPQYSTCKICKVRFARTSNILKPCCSYDCTAKYGMLLLKNKKEKDERNERKETKKAKEGLLTHSDYIQLLQKVFNTYIRIRDKNLPCISCGTTKDVEYAAGHFHPTTYQFLRFNEDNVHKQCNKHCNMMKRGNLSEYRPALINRIGIERVQWLDENRHNIFRISIPELKEKIAYYKQKIKELNS